jgi:hypothetical protein
VIQADRLKLRNWRESDRYTFAMLNAVPEVTQDLGGLLDDGGYLGGWCNSASRY